jgi:glutaminyl-peptide cyclotransferase
MSPQTRRRLLVGSSALVVLALAGALAFYEYVWAQEPARYRVTVLAERPHDRAAFTQGYEISDGVLYESTGQYGQSELRATDPLTGEVLRSVKLPDNHFGEGLTLVGDRIIQLTWREGIAHVWDRDTFERVGEFRYEGEGWGLANAGRFLAMTDGTSTLQLRDPQTFELVAKRTIRLAGRPVNGVNELEFARGFLWGNIYRTDLIAKIDLNSGAIVSLVDATGILSPADSGGIDVLNGIAHDRGTGTFLVTGKLWPKAFEVTMEDQPAAMQ